ncbi:polysaccharide deacetylase family protein [Pseudorhodoferax sp. Leaf267]|uniref:polysaccharide deacetylase family protein n=1 Tax=Pseudorhodoferax sp. Leaf267 TaxID=1736316 RepID=UPI0006FAF00C|nr:polysaccharide deacetylase family protein [Pseudorhodoferax sp. Leaf267]KQP23147.1 glycosyltransferase [Pseudorhodoferax sp. Leaf267]
MLEVSRHTPARLPQGHPPVLCIVIDTEEEFDWDRPFSRSNTATTTIAAQPLAHERIYDALGVVPTYVIDYPVATTPAASAVLTRLMQEGRCEIGTHLHPWVSPPHEEEVNRFNSYTGNLPPALEYAKLDALTHAIADSTGRRPTVFKAGRYGLGPQTSQTLARLGYEIDASVVPHTAFTADSGPDFSAFDVHPYWFETEGRKLLELPVTTGFCGSLRGQGGALYPALQTPLGRTLRLPGIASRAGLLDRLRLTPEGYVLQDLQRLARTLVQDGCQVLSLTYHSPSLAPGHTPYVRDAADLERFLACIQGLLLYFRDTLGGTFMSCTQLRQALR